MIHYKKNQINTQHSNGGNEEQRYLYIDESVNSPGNYNNLKNMCTKQP